MRNEKRVEEIIEKGKFYFLNRQYDEAIEEFQKALELEPQNAKILYNLGIVYESSGDIESAKDFYIKALEREPNFKDAQKHLDRLVGTSEE